MAPLPRSDRPLLPLIAALVVCGVAVQIRAQKNGPYSITGAAGDELGTSVSGVGDLNFDGWDDFIVGAPLDDGNGADSGSVTVRSGKDGAELVLIRGGASNQHFGSSVSGAGDVNGDGYADFIVGAPEAFTNGTKDGLARVYSGRTFTQVAKWEGSRNGDELGYSVSGAGDVNGDGRGDVIVGTRMGNYARVYSASNNWLAPLYTLQGAAGEEFGYSVSGAGDVDADGFDDVIVGAPGADKAYVFSGNPPNPATPVLLFVISGGALDRFGESVGGGVDANGDGFADVIVGAPMTDGSNGVDSGRVTLYSGTSPNPVLHAWDGSAAFDQLGKSVSGLDDVDSDGRGDVLAGAPLADDRGPNSDSGRSVIWSGRTGEVLHRFSGESAGDRFGSSVSGAGDVNGDGLAYVVVGAPMHDGKGQARVFFPPIVEITAAATHSGSKVDDRLGRSVTGLGDVGSATGGPPDGFPDYMVGAAGFVRFFSGKEHSLVLDLKNFPPWVQNDDDFGSAVATPGDLTGDGVPELIIGAPLHDKDLTSFDNGAVFVFNPPNLSLGDRIPGDMPGDRFGWSVSGAGDVDQDPLAPGLPDLIAGAPGDSTRPGYAHVISWRTKAPVLTLGGEQNGDEFGWSVAGAGDINGDGWADLIVGAPSGRSDPNNPNSSRGGYVHFRSGKDGSRLGRLFGGSAGDNLGFSVAGGGDVNGDGIPDLIAGAPRGSAPGYACVIFGGNPVTFTCLPHTGTPGDRFGESVAGAGDVDGDGFADVWVGAPFGLNSQGVATGFAKLFSGRTFEVLATLEGDSADDRFGASVAGVGDVNLDSVPDAIVGAVADDNNGNSSGSARVFRSRLKQGAAFKTYGAGCPGSNGKRARVVVAGPPLIGKILTVGLTSAPASALSALNIGFFAPPPLVKLDLGIIGAPGCIVLTTPVVGVNMLTNPGGNASLDLNVPNRSDLVGAALMFQWLALDLGANALGVIVSDTGRAFFGDDTP